MARQDGRERAKVNALNDLKAAIARVKKYAGEALIDPDFASLAEDQSFKDLTV